ncbi:hypothetical protein Droror1_Dr00027453 [Drosera rotundifolia]
MPQPTDEMGSLRSLTPDLRADHFLPPLLSSSPSLTISSSLRTLTSFLSSSPFSPLSQSPPSLLSSPLSCFTQSHLIQFLPLPFTSSAKIQSTFELLGKVGDGDEEVAAQSTCELLGKVGDGDDEVVAQSTCKLFGENWDRDDEVATVTVSRRRDSVVDIGSRVSSGVNGEGSICSPVKDEVRDDMEKRDGVLYCCSPVGGDSRGSRKKKRGGVVRNRDLVVELRKDEVDLFQQDFAIPCGPSPGRVFLKCLSLTSSGFI